MPFYLIYPPTSPVSLDRLDGDAPIPGRVFKGRVLLNAGLGGGDDEEEDSDDLVSVGASSSASSLVAGSDSDDDHLTAASQTSSSSSRELSVVRSAESNLPVMHASHMKPFTRRLQGDLARAGVKAAPEGSGQQEGAVDLYKANEAMVQLGLQRALRHYEKMWASAAGNSTALQQMPSSIMFCPSPMHIVPDVKVDNATRAALVKPHEAGRRGGSHGLASDKDRLLWVPPSSIAASWQPEKRAAHHMPSSSVTELAVKVAAVRPIVN